MSGIVLSASVRQNLLSLQSTADLLATTQNRLSTGKKVNSALDNPTNFFTAQSLDSRAGDINSLLDGIGNGVQVLQAANTGITSLQKLVDSAKSVANQALQATVGYSSKSSLTTAAISGATADNLLGGAATNATLTGTGALNTLDLTGTAAGHAVATGTSALSTIDLTGTPAAHAVATGSVALSGIDLRDTNATVTGSVDLTAGLADSGSNVTFTINSQTVTLTTGAGGAPSKFTLAYIKNQINTQVGVSASVAATDDGSGHLILTSTSATRGTADAIATTGTASIFGIANTTVNGQTTAAKTFKINNQTVTLAGGTNYTAGNIVSAINTQVGTSAKVSAALTSGSNFLQLTSTSTTTGTGDTLSVNTFSGGSTASTLLGFSGATVSTQGTAAAPAAALTFQVNGNTVTLAGGASYTATQIKDAINAQVGASSNVTAALTSGTNYLQLTSTAVATGTADAITVGTFSTGNATQLGFGALTVSQTGAPASPLADQTFNVNGQRVTLAGGSSYTATQIKDAINTQVGTTAKVSATLNNAGRLVLASTDTPGSTNNVTVNAFSSGSDATLLGYAAGASATQSGANTGGGLGGLTLSIGTTGSVAPSNITFGSVAGQVRSLNDLNAKLASSNLIATFDASTSKITITTTNDAASATIGALAGTAANSGQAFNGVTISSPTQDVAALSIRANLVTQYNNILDQITSTSQDSSYNGVNLLNGDQLKLTFNETNSSQLKLQGVTFNSAGLGLSKLTVGTDFIDNSSANAAIASLSSASSALRSQASALGSNLSIVQIRQDFSKNLINVLQTGSSNLTLADTNEEAANSQALSTRQSIAVSALALANQSQQSVLQLLR